MTADEDIPGAAEVRKQLERTLRAKALRNSPSQAEVLKFVVQSALEGRKISEADIIPLLVVPTHPDPEPSHARATATHLRATLDRYYKDEGSEDPVIITLPPGKAYRPACSYNPLSKAHKSYRLALTHMNRMQSAEDARLALQYLDIAIGHEPTYALAYAMRAESEFREALYRPDESPRTWIARAETSAREALVWEPRVWRAHVVLGAVHCSRFQWDEAKASFNKALECAPLEASEHFYYAAYLAAVGRMDEAQALTLARFKRHPEDPFAQLALAVFYYLTREFMYHPAIAHASDVSRDNLWIASALRACIAFNAGSAYDVLGTLAHGHVEEAHWQFGMKCFPGLAVLCQAHEMSMSENRLRLREMKAQMHRMIADLEIKARAFYVSPLQLALAHIAANETDYAFPELKRACDEGDPKMAWLHLWPLFDPVREHEEFKAMVARMKLP